MEIMTSEYKHWLGELKQRIRQSQIKAAVKVNTELLQLYWQLGSEIVERQQNAKWGDGFLKQLSIDLNEEFPEMKGWSERNLRRIRQWYLIYSQHNIFRTQPVPEIDANTKQVVSQFENDFFSVPWGHHILVAEYTLQSVNSPIGVSSMQIYDQLTADYKSALPTTEEIEAEIRNMEE